LNGKCRLDPDIDILYVFKFESIMESMYRFQGFSGLSDIIGNFSTNKWNIITYNSTYDISNEAGYLSDVSKFPIGTNTWLFHTGEQMPIKISKVNIV